MMSLPAPSISSGKARRSVRRVSALGFDFSSSLSCVVLRRAADALRPLEASPCSPINDLLPN